MKIGNLLDKALAGVSPRTEGPTSSKSTGKTSSLDGGASKSATVTLSSAAASLFADQSDTFDAGKVASIKQAIDNGTYKANAEVIADKLIGNAKDLLQSRRS